MAFFFVHGKCQHYYESGHPSARRGQIVIAQEDQLQSDEDQVVIPPDRVDTLIAWLQEARAELTERQGAAAATP